MSLCGLWPLIPIQYNWVYCEAQKCLAMNLHFRLGSDIFGSKGISFALIIEEWMNHHPEKRIMNA